MLNKELVDLCRTVVGAIQESDSFDSSQLRRLLLHIVPQLLAELDILANVLESVLSQRMPVDRDEPEPAAASEPPPEWHPKKRKRKRKKGRG
jgi:hypothetical protein